MDDLISRRAAIEALWKALSAYEDKTEKQFQESDELDVGDWIEHRIFVQNMSDIDRQTILALPSAQPLDPCETCLHKGKGWDEEPCDGCTGTESKYEPSNGWIPVSERLPDEDLWTGMGKQYSADVLITVHNADDEETIIDYGHTIDGAWYSDTTDCIVPSEWKVTAWMPLPKPY